MAIDIMGAFENEPQPLDFVLPGMLAGSVGAIVSPGGAGKSMAALQIGAALAGGPDLMGLGEYPTGKVVYLPAEDPEPAIIHRLHALGAHVPQAQRDAIAERLVIEPLVGHEINILDARWTNAISRVAQDSRLLILDTLRRFHQADENDSGAMAQVVGRMEAIAASTGCSIIFLHHASKAAAMQGQGDVQQASRGSSVLVDNVRWQSYLAGMSRDEAKSLSSRPFDRAPVGEDERRFFVRWGVSKQNYGPPVPDQWLRRNEGGVLTPADLCDAKKRGGNGKGGAQSEYSS